MRGSAGIHVLAHTHDNDGHLSFEPNEAAYDSNPAPPQLDFHKACQVGPGLVAKRLGKPAFALRQRV